MRTRYPAMGSIVSVMLGVATLIVVNSVMGVFSTKLKERLHGLLSDVVVDTGALGGFRDPQGKMEQIRRDPVLAGKIEAMAGTMEIFAMMQFRHNGHNFTRPVRLIGIDPESRARIGGFQQFLVNERNKAQPGRCFEL